ncbi:MAG: peptidyl-tRNA hydrolase [Thermoplasmata archaeon]|nr:peptidyl-tRNA hydrolase [Thermoplasmata archaeon]
MRLIGRRPLKRGRGGGRRNLTCSGERGVKGLVDVDEFEYKMVIVVRTDLELGKGKMAAQVAHAAVTASYTAWRRKRDLFKRWYEEGQRKVVLKVRSLQELMEIKETAESLGLITALIKDAGLTQIPPGTVTALGIGPEKEEVLDRITGHLKLL